MRDPTGEVHVGQDGWLFLTGGQNRPLAMYPRTLRRSLLLWRWSLLLKLRRRRAAGMGQLYLHCAVPEKLSVYADKVPELGIDPAGCFASGLQARRGDQDLWPDLLGPLLQAGGEGETYLRTDSHWTSHGCRVAHDALCRALGAPLRWRLEERPLVEADMPGDLGEKLDPPVSERLRRREVLQDASRVFANELVLHHERAGTLMALHRGAHVVFRNDAPDADPRRVTIFGDSCAHFVGSGLTAMLAETFREVEFLWSPSIDWGHLVRAKPDIVLTVLAERFMIRVPEDGDYDHAIYAAERLAALTEAPDLSRAGQIPAAATNPP